MTYKCPQCGKSATFVERATVENIFDPNGILINQIYIKRAKKIRCEMCGHYSEEKNFEIPMPEDE